VRPSSHLASSHSVSPPAEDRSGHRASSHSLLVSDQSASYEEPRGRYRGVVMKTGGSINQSPAEDFFEKRQAVSKDDSPQMVLV